MKKILVVDNNDSFVYNIIEYLRQLHNCDITTIIFDKIAEFIKDKFEESSIDDSSDLYKYLPNLFDAIILSPGAKTPQEYEPMMNILDAVADKMPILGICLGHQAIAMHYGIPLMHMSHPRHAHPSQLHLLLDENDTGGKGCCNYCHKSELHKKFLKGITEGSIIGRYHSWVASMPKADCELECLGTDEDGNVMILAHKTLAVFGVQYHPESIITSQGHEIIANFIDLIPEIK